MFILILINILSYGQDIIKTCQVRMNCTLGNQPLPGTGSIKIEKGDSVDVIGIDGGYYKVNYKGTIGYLNDLFIYDPELIKLIKQKKALELAQQESSMSRNREERKDYLIKEYGEKWALYIINKKVCIGMNKAAVIESWREPDDINKTTTAHGVNEQWVYEGENYKNKYLYFDDGVLTTIQE